jgi:hypothetical protein
MNPTSLVLIGAFAAGGYTLVQAPQLPKLPEPPKPPSPPWAQKEPLPSACLEEARRLCAGKQGQEAAECLKSNSAKLCGTCKEGASK